MSKSPKTIHAYTQPLIEWDQDRDEPFCRIVVRGNEYRMTMWRESDADDMVRIWDHPLVGKWSFRRPYPYTRAHLQETFDMFLLPDREALGSYRSFLNSSAPSPAKPERFILRGLRTVEGKLIGNLFGSIVPASDEAEGVQKRESWELGYDLDPDYWGKGLGKRMIGFEVNWAGWLGIDTLVAKVSTANAASEGVCIANGFERLKTEIMRMPEDKGGHEAEFSLWTKKL